MTVACDEVIEQKKALRLEMKARRAMMDESARARASWSLCHRIESWLATRPERIIGVYLARPQEMCLDSLIKSLLQSGRTVAAPRVDVERGEMTFWRLENLEEVEIGPWNVRQPLANQKIEEVPLILAPGLAFDRAGGRLGTGGGWYDRVLRDAQTVVGVGFDCQIVPRVPVEAHDYPVQFVG
ncbi:MAG: 5-formyltetrahydrofolate cyclo-ligase, partial [Armatimonadetes bacterium]|nr:5-formyltetrahydrofolate cyclo-ligase [Armatimonadota bacterium]